MNVCRLPRNFVLFVVQQHDFFYPSSNDYKTSLPLSKTFHYIMIYGRQPHLQTSWQLTCIIPPSNNQPPSTLALLVVVAEIISARENLLLSPSQEWLSAVGWSPFIPHKLRYNKAAVGCTLAVKFVVCIPDTIQPRCGSQESGKATLNMCRWRWVLLGVGVRVTTWFEIPI